MYCSSCGEPSIERARFCAGCGRPLTVSTAAQTTAPPADTSVRDDLIAAISARRELGERLEPEIVESFLERVERGIHDRVDDRVDARVNQRRPAARAVQRAGVGAVGKLAVTLAFGIPLTGVAGEMAGPAGVIGALLALVAINVWQPHADESPRAEARPAWSRDRASTR